MPVPGNGFKTRVISKLNVILLLTSFFFAEKKCFYGHHARVNLEAPIFKLLTNTSLSPESILGGHYLERLASSFPTPQSSIYIYIYLTNMPQNIQLFCDIPIQLRQDFYSAPDYVSSLSPSLRSYSP